MKEMEVNGGVFSRFISHLRDNRRLEIAVYASIFALAFIIFAATGGISCEGKDAPPAAAADTPAADRGAFRTESETESALEAILSGIAGAGKVKVMLMFESTSELVPAMELQSSSGASGESKESSPAKASLGGAEEPIVLAELCPKVLGVIVIAEGAGDIRVKTDLTAAVRALLGIDSGRIGVFSMQRGY